MPDKLEVLYREMSDMTSPLCDSCSHECRREKYRCCTLAHCNLAKKFAKEKYGVELEPTGNSDLPFMGVTGCVVPPHLRPVCTLHICSISWADKSTVNGDERQTSEYFMLREEILREAAVQDKNPEFI